MRRWTVGDLMTTDVISVQEDTPYKDIVETLAGHAVSAVPVVDSERHVLGVVSEADLLHKMQFAGLEPHVHLLERRRRRASRTKASADTATDLMSSPAVVVLASEPVSVAAKLMDAENVKRLPVVDPEGRLAGVVSRSDLLRVYLRGDDQIRDEIVNQVLVGTLWIDPEAVRVTVNRGVVTLAGTVDRRSTAAITVRLVDAVAGVVEVVDHLDYGYDDNPDRRMRYPTPEDVLP